MATQGVQQVAILQLGKENEALKQQLQTMKQVYYLSRLENDRIQKAAADAIDLKTKYDKLHQQHHSLTHELKKKNEEITKLQYMTFKICDRNTISELEQKTLELKDYETLKQNAIDLQIRNADLVSELEHFRQAQLFSTKVNAKQEKDSKWFTTVRLDWDRNIQNLQLNYRIENDLLILEGYGEMNERKVVYQQQIELRKRVKRELDKPAVSLKNSTMVLVFEN